MSGRSRKQLTVHAFVERKDADKPSIWLEVGVASANRDGNINLIFDAFPVGTNRLQVREQRFPEESRNGSTRAAPLEALPLPPTRSSPRPCSPALAAKKGLGPRRMD